MTIFKKILTSINADMSTFYFFAFVPMLAILLYIFLFEAALFPLHIEINKNISYIKIYPKNDIKPAGRNYNYSDSNTLKIVYANHVIPLHKKTEGDVVYYQGGIFYLIGVDRVSCDSLYNTLRATFPDSRITVSIPKGAIQFYSVVIKSHNEFTLYRPVLWLLWGFSNTIKYIARHYYNIVIVSLIAYGILLIIKTKMIDYDDEEQHE